VAGLIEPGLELFLLPTQPLSFGDNLTDLRHPGFVRRPVDAEQQREDDHERTAAGESWYQVSAHTTAPRSQIYCIQSMFRSNEHSVAGAVKVPTPNVACTVTDCEPVGTDVSRSLRTNSMR